MTPPLPTLAEIDSELVRSQEARAAACDEIASLLIDVADLDGLVDEMLEHRARVAALPVS